MSSNIMSPRVMPRRVTLPISLALSSVLALAIAVAPLACGRAQPVAAGSAVPAGIVSSAHELASRTGVEILEAGGNAFDAAVAVAAVLTVVEPMNSNLFGGYGTLLIWDDEAQRLRYLDNNGRFPRAVDSAVFRAAPDRESILRTAQAVSTPGNLRGFEALWREQGSLEWAQLLAPAIRAAEEGAPVSEPLARAIAGAWEHLDGYARDIFGKPAAEADADGEAGTPGDDDRVPLEAGDLLVQTDLSRSLRLAAEQGADALHGGELGAALDAEMKRRGGFLALADLREHRSEWLEPIGIDYRDARVATAGPPSNSFAALVCLGLSSRFDLAEMGPSSVEYLHTFAEATKHAFWARLRWAGGPEENPPPLETLLSELYWSEQAERIDPERASRFLPPALDDAEGESTTHYVVADDAGNVVSATITLGHGFGSAVMVEGAGILLNNSLAYSTFEPPGNPMDALPGRRKHSSKTPVIILREGRPWVAIGTPGGHTIPQTTPQMVIQLLDFGRSLQEALDAPRMAFAEPDRLVVEESLGAEAITALETLGHRVVTTRSMGLAHALEIERGTDGRPIGFRGAVDPRGVGVALMAKPRP
ncbi:MAG TPA: gamma-glutamyltransferase family protein [Thermoanaerobaculia bacterium]|nr:gamma-glutamyltransferase family protein [Thermoanaerobaculia bacterium]